MNNEKFIENNKKILFVASSTAHINVFHIPYLKYFKENGYEVHVASRGTENIEYCDKHFNLPFQRFPLKSTNFNVYKQLKRIIEKEKYKIVHCHTPTAGVIARLASRKVRKTGTKVLYTAHGFHFYKGAPVFNWVMYYPIEKVMSRYTDCLITITKEDYEFAKKHLKKAKTIEHINGIGMNKERFDIEISEEEKHKLTKELDISKDEIVLSYVAELNKNKNQILLINVVEKLIKEGHKIKLILIGDGPLKEEYIRIVRKKDLSNHTLILGKRKDVPQLLSVTNIYVASSIREGLPVNIMEAMYMGLPVVATDNRGHRELVKNNENGFIIKNEIEMTEKINELIKDENLIKTFAEKGKEKSIIYQIDNVIQDMKKIYSKL